MNRNAMSGVDPEEEARRTAISRVMTGGNAVPRVPGGTVDVPGLEAPEPVASTGLYSRNGSARVPGPAHKMPVTVDVPPDVQAARDAEKANPTGPHYGDRTPDGGFVGGFGDGITKPGQAAPQINLDPPIPIDFPNNGASVPAPAAKTYGLSAGYDQAKLASGHDSPKYQIGRTLQKFDPQQGVTPEVLAALNALGLGNFSGSGDKVNIANGDPRFNGVTAIDLARDFSHADGSTGASEWDFGVDDGSGGAAAAPSQPGETLYDNGGVIGTPSAAQSPQDSLYERLLRQLQETVGTPGADQAAIAKILGGR